MSTTPTECTDCPNCGTELGTYSANDAEVSGEGDDTYAVYLDDGEWESFQVAGFDFSFVPGLGMIGGTSLFAGGLVVSRRRLA